MVSTLTGSTELCDTEGASKYPLGTLGTPIASTQEEVDYPPGNPGCTPEDKRAVSEERQKAAAAAAETIR